MSSGRCPAIFLARTSFVRSFISLTSVWAIFVRPPTGQYDVGGDALVSPLLFSSEQDPRLLSGSHDLLALRHLLQGPAVAVRIAEGYVQDAPEILYLTHVHPAVGELGTRRVYVWDDQVEAPDRAW